MVVIRRLKNIYHLLRAILAVVCWRWPGQQVFVIGVTGTDGKTTTVHLIDYLLRSAGKKTAMISTVSAPGFHVTTPDSWQLQCFLRQAVKEGKKYVILEATSHGLDQFRLWGCHFQMGVLTNVTHEHLDYHRTWEEYLRAKARLFQGVKYAILNKDDDSYEKLKTKITFRRNPAKRAKQKIISYAIKNRADVTSKNFPFQTKLPGEYNQYNCLAAIAAGKMLGISDKKIRQAVASFPGVKGRLEEVKAGQSFRVVVDFAHTANAFQQVLATVRAMTQGKLIHVFGCTGDRDKTKRPLMGEISARWADKIVLTHEDTYSEDINQIIDQIEPGVKKGGKRLGRDYWRVNSRREAIKKALQMADKNDTILITGVGHQTSLNIDGKEVSWSDQKVVKEFL